MAKTLEHYVKQGMHVITERMTAIDELTAICEAAAIELDLSKSQVKSRIEAAYKKKYDSEKFLERKHEIEGLYSDLEGIDIS